jgi:cytoskeletal protein CcmA (bactofilin family)
MKRTKNLILIIAALIISVLAYPSTVSASPLSEDRTIIGESYTLESGRILDGDLNVIGGVVQIEENATINGDVFVLGGLVTIDGTIKGDLTAIGGTVTLHNTAIVKGDLISPVSYINIDPGATILGEQLETAALPGIRVDHLPSIRPQLLRPRTWNLWPVLSRAAAFLSTTLVMVALGAFLLLIMPKPAERMAAALHAAPWHLLGYGALTAVVMASSIVLVITICLIPLIALVGMAFILALLVGWLALGYELGKMIARDIFKTTWHPVLTAAIGNFVLYLVAWGVNRIPCVGWLPVLITMLFALGMAVTTLFGTYRYPRTAEPDQDQEPVVLFEKDAQQSVVIPEVKEAPAPEIQPKPVVEEVTIEPDLPIEVLNLGGRINNILTDAGLTTVREVLDRLEGGDDALLEISGFGEKSLADLKHALVIQGYEIPRPSDEE